MARRALERTHDVVRAEESFELPPFEPPTLEEIARRTKLIERIRRLREEIGPIGIASDDLIHLARSMDEL